MRIIVHQPLAQNQAGKHHHYEQKPLEVEISSLQGYVFNGVLLIFKIYDSLEIR